MEQNENENEGALITKEAKIENDINEEIKEGEENNNKKTEEIT